MTIGQYRNVNDVSCEIKDEKKESRLKKIVKNSWKVLVPLAMIGGSLSLEEYIAVEKPCEMVETAEGVLHPLIDSSYMYNTYLREKEMNGFLHNTATWKAYQEKTKKLNGGNLKNILYLPDANHNGRSD